MTTNRGDQAVSGERVVVLPDLDREFTGALGEVEELLLTLRWQETGDPDGLVVHPAALGGGGGVAGVAGVAPGRGHGPPDPDRPGLVDRWAAAGPGRPV